MLPYLTLGLGLQRYNGKGKRRRNRKQRISGKKSTVPELDDIATEWKKKKLPWLIFFVFFNNLFIKEIYAGCPSTKKELWVAI